MFLPSKNDSQFFFFISRVYTWCILSSVAEKKGAAARWLLLDSLTDSRLKMYSHKVSMCYFTQFSWVGGWVGSIIAVHHDMKFSWNCLDHYFVLNGNHLQVHKALHKREIMKKSTGGGDTGTFHLSASLLEGEESTDKLSDVCAPVQSQNRDPTPLGPLQPHATHNPQKNLGHHWGVQAQVLQGICYCCHLRLPTQALVSEGGITVFLCSHAYHTIRLSHRGHCCIICLQTGS